MGRADAEKMERGASGRPDRPARPTRPERRDRAEAARPARPARQSARDRVAARREQREQEPARPARPAPRTPTRTAQSLHTRSRRAPRPAGSPAAVALGQQFVNARRRLRSSLASATGVLRQRRQTPPRQRRGGSFAGSQVRPGLRQQLAAWVGTGRLLSLVLCLAALGALAYLFVSPRFLVGQITVEGNRLLRSAKVAELAGLRGTPIWFVNSEAVATRLLDNAYVEQASVEVVLPNHARIGLIERRPEVRWQIGGRQYLLDGGGRVLDVAHTPAEPGTLVIVDASSQALQPKEYVDPDALELARALALRLPTELQVTPATIGWDFGLGIYVELPAGQRVVFGQTEQLDRKLAVLAHLLEDGTTFHYLDLRPADPFYRVDD